MSPDYNRTFQGLVDRTFVSNVEKPILLLTGQFTGKFNLPLDAIDAPCRLLTVLAVLGMNLVMTKTNRDVANVPIPCARRTFAA